MNLRGSVMRRAKLNRDMVSIKWRRVLGICEASHCVAKASYECGPAVSTPGTSIYSRSDEGIHAAVGNWLSGVGWLSARGVAAGPGPAKGDRFREPARHIGGRGRTAPQVLGIPFCVGRDFEIADRVRHWVTPVVNRTRAEMVRRCRTHWHPVPGRP